jgi:hypothetical protein
LTDYSADTLGFLTSFRCGGAYEVGMLIGSDLSGRTQFVRFGGRESFVIAGTCGVSQESVRGPLLFV